MSSVDFEQISSNYLPWLHYQLRNHQWFLDKSGILITLQKQLGCFNHMQSGYPDYRQTEKTSSGYESVSTFGIEG